MSVDSEFVTIAEAARRLGISERQARRDAQRLSGHDRRVSGTGPAHVRLAALAAAGNRPFSDSEEAPDRAGHDRHVSGNGGHAPDMRARADAEMIAQLRGEVERLNAALERTQQALGQSLAALTAEQQRTALLEAQQARLIEALPPAALQNQSQEAPEAPQSGDRDEGGEPGRTGDCELQEAGPRRPWWQWWRRSKEGASRA